MKLAVKLSILFLAVALLNIGVGFFSARISEDNLSREAGEKASFIARQTLKEVDREIYSMIEDWKRYADNPCVRKPLAASNRKFEAIGDVAGYIKEKEWAHLPKEETTPALTAIQDNPLSKQLKEIVDFHNTGKTSPNIGEVLLTNRWGVNIAQSRRTSDYYQADETWWKRAQQDGIFVEDVHYDGSAGIYAFNICIRVDDDTGGFMGVLKVVVNSKSILGLVKEVEQGVHEENGSGTAHLTLATGEGRILYSSKGEAFFTRLAPARYALLTKVSPRSYVLTRDSTGPAGKKLIAYARSRGFKKFPGLGWILAVEYDAGMLLAPAGHIKYAILGVSVVSFIFSVILCFFIVRSIAVSLGRLADAAEKVGSGKLDTRVMISPRDGIGFLAASFNKMVADLEKTTTSVRFLNRQIEERENVEKTLKQSEQRLLKAQRVAKIGFLDWDLESNELYWSDEVFRIYGVSSDVRPTIEMATAAVHPDDAASVKENLDAATGRGKRYDIVHRIIKPSGEIAWVHAQAELFHDEAGSRRLLGTIVDITSQTLAEEKARRTFYMMHSILDKAPIGIYIINSEGNIEYVNRQMIAICGDTEEQFMSLNAFTLPTYRDSGIVDKMKAALKGEPFFMDNVRYTSYYGKKETVRNFTGMPFEEDGKRKILMFVEDITPLRKAIGDLKGKIKELERFHAFIVDRELKMRDLKRENRELKEKTLKG